MVQFKTKRKSRNLLKLKKLSQHVPKSVYQKYQDQELKLFEDQNVEIKKEETDNEIINKRQKVKQSYVELLQDEHDEGINVDLSKVARLRKLMKKDGQTKVSGKEYQKRLREFYQGKIQSSAFLNWSQKQHIPQNETKELTLQEILTQNVQDVEYKSQILPSKIIDIEKAGGTSDKIRGDAVVQCISFHYRLPLFVTGGLDKTLRFYQINHNKKIELKKVITLEKYPINKVQFMNTNNDVIVSSNFSTVLLSVDILTSQVKQFRAPQSIQQSAHQSRFNKQIEFVLEEDDKYIAIFNDTGYIYVLDGLQKQFLFEFKQNEMSLCGAFGEGYLFTAGLGGKIYQWNLREQKIQNVFHNPGGNEINCLSYRANNLAVGTRTGIVNIFKFDPLKQTFDKQPIKELQNLTTQVDNAQFNEFGDILCISSRWKENALRLVHIDSLTVFENWPDQFTILKKVNSFSFSKDSRFLAIGNENGHVRVYRLLHY
ncbi:hypothetical protein pb186bvf_016877 [Paramecium bursaria]